MKVLFGAIIALSSSFCFANPMVKQNTDLGERKVTSHNQVTRCEDGKCVINSVTTFDKSTKKAVSYAECTIADDKNQRFSQCETMKKKKKMVKKVVVKAVESKQKKNRIQVHAGAGPDGLYEKTDNNKTSISENLKPIVGLQYSRVLENDFSVGVSGFSNKSLTFSIGIDY